jgi:peptidoglycan/xylan/chitin deacetylase (PgdA/CDA1 family)
MRRPDPKNVLYRAGILGLYHRIRNRRTLTVIMFHRVLDPGDARWRTCDPDYTISAQLFVQCLELFRRHYNVVSLDDVLRAQSGSGSLPDRALLVTFDDGWQDNFEYALPILVRMRLPAVLFAVADAIGRSEAFFQERLVAAWRAGRLGAKELADLRHLAGCPSAPQADASGMGLLRETISALEALAPERRLEVLRPFHSILDDGERHNLSADELRELSRAGVAIGAHGLTHTPLTRVTSARLELVGARERLSGMLGQPADSIASVSCPHGKYDATVVREALDAGYRLVFTSHPAMNVVAPGPSQLLARVGFEAADVSDEAGRLLPERLATYLFRRPAVRLG